ncbi:MAG: hypothetical protein K2X32_11175 [Phycisphaerales bacterium]|nr:hypothetical protein [Phycisphaerales bacterium]
MTSMLLKIALVVIIVFLIFCTGFSIWASRHINWTTVRFAASPIMKSPGRSSLAFNERHAHGIRLASILVSTIDDSDRGILERLSADNVKFSPTTAVALEQVKLRMGPLLDRYSTNLIICNSAGIKVVDSMTDSAGHPIAGMVCERYIVISRSWAGIPQSDTQFADNFHDMMVKKIVFGRVTRSDLSNWSKLNRPGFEYAQDPEDNVFLEMSSEELWRNGILTYDGSIDAKDDMVSVCIAALTRPEELRAATAQSVVLAGR